MSLAMPQPDFEPSLRLHLSAFSVPAEVEPDRFGAPGDEDEDADPVGNHPKHRASQMFVIRGDRH
jgi:hypothetical protein